MKRVLISLLLVSAMLLPAYAAPPAAPAAAVASAPAIAISGLAVTPPANCNTGAGFPCAKLTWNGPSCAAAVSPATLSPTSPETAGPCVFAVLRCSGGSAGCSASTLPPLAGASSATAISTAPGGLGTGNGWTLLTQAGSQTASASDPYFDNNGLVYGGLYNYVVLLAFTGPGGGVWAPYSGIFQLQMPAAPAPTPAAPQAATSGSAVTQ